MSHLVCPLCGKHTALSTLSSEYLDSLDLDIKVAGFKGLGRGKGFVKSEEYSILGDDEYTPIITDKIEKLYNMSVNRGLLVRSIDDSTLNMIKENYNLKNQIAIKNSRILSINVENKEKDSEIEELELRSHVYYIILEGLSLDQSVKTRHDPNSHYLVLTHETTALNCFLILLMKEIPSRLREQLLPYIDFENIPIMKVILRNVQERRTVAEELMEDTYLRFKGLDYTGKDPYTLKLSELKKIVSQIKDTVSDPEALHKWIQENFNPEKTGEQNHIQIL